MNHGKENSLVMRVVDRLVSGIVNGEYPGNLPPQDILSKKFNVSRTVMREALSMLISRRMLDVRPKTGTRIKPMCDWQMIDEDVIQWRFRAKPDWDILYDWVEFCEFIEPRAAALAAIRADLAERAAIRTAHNVLAQAVPGETTYQQADIAWHTTIIQASGNQILQQMVPIVRVALLAIPSMNASKSVASVTAAASAMQHAHRRVIDAIDVRDAIGADAAMAALIAHMKGEIPRMRQ